MRIPAALLLCAVFSSGAGREVAITIDDLPRGGDGGPRTLAGIRAMTVQLLQPFREQHIPVIGFVNEGRNGDFGPQGLREIAQPVARRGGRPGQPLLLALQHQPGPPRAVQRRHPQGRACPASRARGARQDPPVLPSSVPPHRSDAGDQKGHAAVSRPARLPRGAGDLRRQRLRVRSLIHAAAVQRPREMGSCASASTGSRIRIAASSSPSRSARGARPNPAARRRSRR